MAADIGVYNFSWKDMGVPTLFKMMDIVQVSMLVAKRALLRRTLTCCGHSQQRGAAMHSCTRCIPQQTCTSSGIAVIACSCQKRPCVLHDVKARCP